MSWRMSSRLAVTSARRTPPAISVRQNPLVLLPRLLPDAGGVPRVEKTSASATPGATSESSASRKGQEFHHRPLVGFPKRVKVIRPGISIAIQVT